MRKKKAIICIVISAALLGTSGCSYKEFEDSLRSALKGEKTSDLPSDYVNEASINTEDDGEKDKNVYYVGDTIKSENPVFGEEVWYTLNNVNIVKDVNELGISMADFSTSFSNRDKISEEGKLQEGYSFIAANVSVKNIRGTYVHEETGDNMEIEWQAAAETGILDPTGIVGLELAYFSGHNENRERYYYWFSLPVGEEETYTVGWVVSDQMLKEPFYYIIQGGDTGDTTKNQYFLLNGTE